MQFPAQGFPTSRPVEPHLVAKPSLNTSRMVKITEKPMKFLSLRCRVAELNFRID
jgi:hypothetical protein